MDKIEIGKLIKEAVIETDKWVANNTNLGIIMLLTPLSAAAGMSSDIDELQDNVDQYNENHNSHMMLQTFMMQ